MACEDCDDDAGDGTVVVRRAEAGPILTSEGSPMVDEPVMAREKKCPQCGHDILAWVSSSGDEDTFECRRCHTLFRYRGEWS